MHPTPREVSFGLLPRQTQYGDGNFPTMAERPEIRMLDRDVWQPVSLNRHVPLIYSQLDGMCTSNGSTMAMMVERSIRFREYNPILSPEYLYYLHSQWGTGSSLDVNLQTLVDHGTLTVEQAGAEGKSYDKETHEADAQFNRMLEFVDLNANFDAVASALQRRRPCVIGVKWPGSRRGGHAICATQLIYHHGTPSTRGPLGGCWQLRGPNSWSEDWGEKPSYSPEDLEWLQRMGRKPLTGGFWTLTESQCADFSTFGCWAVGTSV